MSKYFRPQVIDVAQELAKLGDDLDLPDDLANSIPMPKIPPPPPLPTAEPGNMFDQGQRWSDARLRTLPAVPSILDNSVAPSVSFRRGRR
jgi:hypothetical protein